MKIDKENNKDNKNKTLEEKLEDLEKMYKILEEISLEVDDDTEKATIDTLNGIYKESRADGIPDKYLKKFKELAKQRKKDYKIVSKKHTKEFKEKYNNLQKDIKANRKK